MEEIYEKIKVLISEEEIKERVQKIAKKITEDYNDEELVAICILKGSLYFTVDLTKNIQNKNLIIDFMRVSSYGNEFKSSGNIKIKKDLDINIENKNVLVIEDIIDSGNTLYYLREELLKRNPKSFKICTLLDKKARREKDINPDYVCFEIDDKFVVGYGLDYKDLYRNLPYVGYVEIGE